MGNLVPTPGQGDGSVAAPIAYAVDHLGVEVVVVCGHSGCGAMAAAHDADGSGPAADGPVADDPVTRWLAHATPSVEAWRAGHPVGEGARAAGLSASDQLGQVNVAVSVARMREVLGAGRDDVRVVGLWFSIADGTLSVLQGDGFVPLTDNELAGLGALDAASPVTS